LRAVAKGANETLRVGQQQGHVAHGTDRFCSQYKPNPGGGGKT